MNVTKLKKSAIFTKRKLQLVFALGTAILSIVLLLLLQNRFQSKDGFCSGLYALGFLFTVLTLTLNLIDRTLLDRWQHVVSPLLFAGCAPLILWMMEILFENKLSNLSIVAVVFNLILILLLSWSISALTNRIGLSLRIVAVICYILSLANSMVTEFRGQPISALDIFSWRTAASVAGGYHFSFPGSFWVATLLLVLIWVLAGFAHWKPVGKRRYFANIGLCLLSVTLFFYGFYRTDLLKKVGISDYLWNQKLAFHDNGTLLSLVYSTRYLIVEVADNYSPERAEEIVTGSPAYLPEETEIKPNIIAIMNESFADLSIIRPLETNEDYMPFYHSLSGAKNALTGDLVVSTFGGGTSNTEFEFLSGCTLGFFPAGSVVYQQYLRNSIPSLVSTLESYGYTSAAIHPFYSYCWNRDSVYPLLGFDDFLDINDFHGAKAVGGYMGTSVSDEADYDKLIELFENKGEDEKLFLFNVTIQNHGGYDKIVGCDSSIHISNLSKDYPSADNYLSLVRESDEQLRQLVTYFEGVDEPTLLVFFGDHQPNLSSEFYDELYGDDSQQLTLSKLQNKFITPFVIWANYDIGSQNLGTVSANYLSTLVLKAAGLQMPPYNQYLYRLYQRMPVINLNGYRSNKGVDYSFEETSPYSEDIEAYRILQYNLMFDKKGRVDRLYSVARTE